LVTLMRALCLQMRDGVDQRFAGAVRRCDFHVLSPMVVTVSTMRKLAGQLIVR
jgi:hypothetical protein